MVNEKKNIFHTSVVWFIIGFISAGLCTGLLFSSSEEIRNAGTTNSTSDIPKRTIDKQNSDVEKQRTELNNNLQKANQSVITLEKQQTMLKTSYDNKIKYLESCNQTLEQESKEYKRKIKQLKAEKTLLYVGLGTVLLIAIS